MFDRVLNAPLFSIHISDFECPHSHLLQRLGVLNPFRTTIPLISKTNQLTKNPIDRFLYGRDCGLEWNEKGVKF